VVVGLGAADQSMVKSFVHQCEHDLCYHSQAKRRPKEKGHREAPL